MGLKKPYPKVFLISSPNGWSQRAETFLCRHIHCTYFGKKNIRVRSDQSDQCRSRDPTFVEVWIRAKAKAFFLLVLNFQKLVSEIVPKTCISHFYVDDLRSGHFNDLPIIRSRRGTMESFPFDVYLSARRNSFRIMSSLAIHDDPGASFEVTPLKVVWGHQSFFLLVAFNWEEMQTWEWSHCVYHIKTHRLICNMTCLGQLESPRNLDPRSNFDVDLSRSNFT